MGWSRTSLFVSTQSSLPHCQMLSLWHLLQSCSFPAHWRDNLHQIQTLWFMCSSLSILFWALFLRFYVPYMALLFFCHYWFCYTVIHSISFAYGWKSTEISGRNMKVPLFPALRPFPFSWLSAVGRFYSSFLFMFSCVHEGLQHTHFGFCISVSGVTLYIRFFMLHMQFLMLCIWFVVVT